MCSQVFRLNVHPAYNSSNFHNDIAVLTLSSDVQFTTFVRPICVWEPENNIHDIVGTEGVVSIKTVIKILNFRILRIASQADFMSVDRTDKIEPG